VACGFGGLGGVLGEVGGDLAVGQLTASGVDTPHVDLLAPGDQPALRPVGVRGCGDGDLASDDLDRFLQVVGGDAGRRRHERVRVVGIDAVEA
jgi:hypothetical protein